MSYPVLDQVKGRSPCVQCGRSCKFYCYNCCVLVSELQDKIQSVKLPLKIDIIRHPSECDGKSTATHAAVLSPDVTLFTYPCVPDYTKEQTVLVFPSDASFTLQEYILKMSCHSEQSKVRVEIEPAQKTRDNDDIISPQCCDKMTLCDVCTADEKSHNKAVITGLSEARCGGINHKIEQVRPLLTHSNLPVDDVNRDVSTVKSANDCHLSVSKRTIVTTPDSHCGDLNSSDVKKARLDKHLSDVLTENDNEHLTVVGLHKDTITTIQIPCAENHSEQATNCAQLINGSNTMNIDINGMNKVNKESEPCVSIETAISDNVLVRDTSEYRSSPGLFSGDGSTVETPDIIDEDESITSTPGMFTKVVFVDSRWTQTQNIVMDERLKDLPHIKLSSYETRFWRHMENTSRSNLATLEAVYYFLCEYHTHVLRKMYLGEYDGIMVFFNYMYSKLGNIQARVKGKK